MTASGLTVSVWTDSSGSLGDQLAETDTHRRWHHLRTVVSWDGLGVFLLPETKYWIRFGKRRNSVEGGSGWHNPR